MKISGIEIIMPEQTPDEIAALIADNEEALKLFVNQNRKTVEPPITFPVAILVSFIPATLLYLGALAIGWRP